MLFRSTSPGRGSGRDGSEPFFGAEMGQSTQDPVVPAPLDVGCRWGDLIATTGRRMEWSGSFPGGGGDFKPLPPFASPTGFSLTLCGQSKLFCTPPPPRGKSPFPIPLSQPATRRGEGPCVLFIDPVSPLPWGWCPLEGKSPICVHSPQLLYPPPPLGVPPPSCFPLLQCAPPPLRHSQASGPKGA